MANLKNITDLPVAESAEGLNLIVNDNGAAKQIAASAVGAQADFAVTDETSPAFIKNKPDYDAIIKIEEDYSEDNDVCNITVEKGSLDDTIEMIKSGKKPKILFYGVQYYGQALPIVAEVNNLVVYENEETGNTEVDFLIHWGYGYSYNYRYGYAWTPDGVESR